MRRLVTGFAAIATISVLGVVVACGGGELPDAAIEEPIADAGSRSDVVVGAGAISLDIDVEKGITFGENGLVSCGTKAADRTLTIKNTSINIVNYTATLVAGEKYYTVTPTSGGIPGGGNATLVLSPLPIPVESDVAADLYAATLELKFPGLGVPPTNIRLHQTASGAIINSSAGDTLDLGSAKVGESNKKVISLTNVGNAEATATFKLGTEVFTVGGAAESVVKLGAGASESRELKLAPVGAGDLTDTLAITYNSSAVFCKTPPSEIALTGKGTTSVGVSAGTLDFGLVNCGTTGDPQTVTISSTVAMTFTAVLTKGNLSPYTLQNDADGSPVSSSDNVSVPAASSFKLRITPKKIEAPTLTTDNLFGDDLTITTAGVAGDTPKVIKLRQTAKGAILGFNLASVTVTGPVGQQINTNFSLINTGNAPVPYAITTDPVWDTLNPGFKSTLTTGTAGPGSTTNGVLISKAPTAKGSITTGSMSVALGAGGGVLCADLPPAMPLSVTGTGSAITVNPTNLNYGVINCGSGAQPQFFTLSATVENNIKLSLGLGPSSPYSFSKDEAGTEPIANNTSVNVKPGADVTVWVRPSSIPVPSPVGSYNDEITLTSDIASEEVRKVPLTMGVIGGVFSLPATVQEGADVAIANTGNAIAKLTISGQSTVTGDRDVAAGATLTIKATTPGTITVAPRAGSGSCVGTGTITVEAKPAPPNP